MNIIPIYIIILLFGLITTVYTTDIDVNSLSELKNALQSQNNDITINVKNEIIINDSDFLTVGDTITKITIKGISTTDSKIIFSTKNSGIFFGRNINDVEIMDISFESEGSVLYFDNNLNVNIYNVHITGFTEVNMDSISKNIFTITDVIFNTPKSPINYLLKASFSNLIIDNSKFYGSESLLISCLYVTNRENSEAYVSNEYDKLAYGEIDINNSLFSGGYTSRGIIVYFVSNINIKNSEIKDCYNNVRDGSFNCYYCNKVTVNNSFFHDNYTTQIGGSISLYRAKRSFLENILFVNTTAEGQGSAMFMYSEKIDESISFVKNNTLKDVYARVGDNSRGHFISFYGYIDITIEDIYCDNVNSYKTDGSLFFVNEDIKMTIKNMNLSNIYGSGIGSLFINTLNNKNLVIHVDTLNVRDCFQSSMFSSSILLWLNPGSSVKLTNVSVMNSGGNYASLLTQLDQTNVEINNLYVDGFNSKIPCAFFDNEVQNPNSVSLKINNANIRNVESLGTLILMQGSQGEITNSEFVNIHTCFMDKSKKCDNGQPNKGIRESTVGNFNKETTFIFENITISNLYGIRGFINSRTTVSTFKNFTLKNSYFENGFINLNYDESSFGFFRIYNSTFDNIEGIKGSVINVMETLDKNFELDFNNSVFRNNYSSRYGGVIYTIEETSSKNIKFNNCEFYNNTSKFGNIVYSLNKETEPYFYFDDETLLDKYKSIQNTFATNPTRLFFNEDSYKINDILSGTFISEFIKVNIYDDYNNKLSFGEDIDELNMSDLAFFKVEVTDRSGQSGNADIVGQNRGYCWEDSCSINNIQIIGVPGEYQLTLELVTFGLYYKFSDDKIAMDFNILECNETEYIYQVKEHKLLKSCYKPKCDPSCNSGKCINDNVCDCSSTAYTGLHCNEHYKVERIMFIDISYRIIAFILCVVSTILIVVVFINRNVPIIKGGGYPFLILILIGLYFNAGYIISLTFERSKVQCILIYILKNLSFSLVFGSILVKTLRVHIIFKYVKHSVKFKPYKMYLIIGSFIIYHSLLVIIWSKYNGLTCDIQYNKNNEMYQGCIYHKTKVFSTLFNLSVVLLGIWLAYSIRYVNENFRENLAIPIYIYSLSTLLSEIVENIEDLPITYKDSTKNVFSVIYTMIILHFLYIQKFYIMYFTSDNSTNSKTSIFTKKSNVIKENLINIK